MKYHVVTPFSRPANYTPLKEMLRPMGVDWHILMDQHTTWELPNDEDWIKQYSFPKVEPAWKMWRQCINQFAWLPEIVDGDRYAILNDDDFYEPGFFEKIDAVDAEVIICSMKRGDAIPAGIEPFRAHGTDTLVGCQENMVPCRVSTEQIILSGRLFRKINLVLHQHCDGLMIEAMVNDFGAIYVPDAYVWFNYLEPGRWESFAKSQPRE